MIGLFIIILYLVGCFITHICVYSFLCHLYKKGYRNWNNEKFADWYDRHDCDCIDVLISCFFPISVLIVGVIFLIKGINTLIKNILKINN